MAHIAPPFQSLPEAKERALQLARATRHAGDVPGALRQMLTLVPLPPGHPAWGELGALLNTVGDHEQAAMAYAHAVLRGGTPELFLELGRSFRALHRPGEALAALEVGLRLEFLPDLQVQAGLVCLDLGLHERAWGYLRPLKDHPALQGLLGALIQDIYLRGSGPRGAHEAATERLPERLRVYTDPRSLFPVGTDPHRRLRVGFLSECYLDHPVAQWLLDWVGAFDPQEVESVGLHLQPVSDDVTARFQRAFHRWVPLGQMDLDARVTAVRSLELDLLVDLCEHRRLESLELLAQRLAPIQAASTMAFAGTRGLPNLDVRFTDPLSDPPGEADRWCLERLYRLEGPRRAIRIPDEVGVRPQPPCLGGEPFTYGCLVTPCKVTPTFIATVAELLRQEPDARLLLLWYGQGDARGEAFRRGQFTDHGVRPDQIQFRHRAPRAHYLSYYRDVDLSLDPFPIFGGTTVLESLWMGVPVLHLDPPENVRHGGRSLLHEVGLPEWVVSAREAFVAKARALKADPTPLEDLRTTLRPRLRQSTLMDYPRVARVYAEAFRALWTEWCEDRFPGPGPWNREL